MRRSLRFTYFSLVFTILLALSGRIAFSTEDGANGLWPNKIKVGGEFRFRPEAQINYDFDSSAPLDDYYYYLRTRVYLDLNPMDGVQIFAMYQDSETFDQFTTINATPSRHQFYQGFVSLKNRGDLTARVKMGRQELIYGDQRLIGNFDWGNLGRYFDGLAIRIENPAFWLDVFGTRIKPPNGIEQQFGGAYGHLKKFPNGELEPYVLILHGNTAGLGKGELSLVTIGTRVVGKFKKNFDYGFEGAYQTGLSAGNLVSAFATHARIGYTFPKKWKPRVGVEFDFASGDNDPANGTVTLFNNLFPTNHDKYGLMDLFSWRNMYDIGLYFTAQPTDFMWAKLGFNSFWLAEPANGSFTATGTQFRAGDPNASRYAGEELDISFKFKPIKYIETQIGYGVFFPGAFFADTGGSDIAQFFYTSVIARY